MSEVMDYDRKLRELKRYKWLKSQIELCDKFIEDLAALGSNDDGLDENMKDPTTDESSIRPAIREEARARSLEGGRFIQPAEMREGDCWSTDSDSDKEDDFDNLPAPYKIFGDDLTRDIIGLQMAPALGQPSGMERRIWPHQDRGAGRLCYVTNSATRGGLLADAFGLGKTVTVISAMLHMMEQYETRVPTPRARGPVLIVTAGGVLRHWMEELEGRSVKGRVLKVIRATTKTTVDQVKNCDVILATHTFVHAEWTRIQNQKASFQQGNAYVPVKCCILSETLPKDGKHFTWAVFDDIQNIGKHWDSETNRALRKIRRNATILVSSTPGASLDEICGMVFQHLQGGCCRSKRTFDKFLKENVETKLSKPEPFSKKDEALPEEKKALMREEERLWREEDKHANEALRRGCLVKWLQSVVIARPAGTIKRPRMDLEDVFFDLDEQMAEAANAYYATYREAKAKKFKEFEQALKASQRCGLGDRGSGEVKGKNKGLAEGLKDMSTMEAGQDSNLSLQPSPRIEKLLEKIQEDASAYGDSKIVVVSKFNATLDAVEQLLSGHDWNCYKYEGRMRQSQRDINLANFKKSVRAKSVLLMTARTGAEGINVPEASRLYQMELWRRKDEEAQAHSRIHRPESTRNVLIRRLVAENSRVEIDLMEKLREETPFEEIMRDIRRSDECFPDIPGIYQDV